MQEGAVGADQRQCRRIAIAAQRQGLTGPDGKLGGGREGGGIKKPDCSATGDVDIPFVGESLAGEAQGAVVDVDRTREPCSAAGLEADCSTAGDVECTASRNSITLFDSDAARRNLKDAAAGAYRKDLYKGTGVVGGPVICSAPPLKLIVSPLVVVEPRFAWPATETVPTFRFSSPV